MTRTRIVTAVVLTLTIVGVLGHVCVLPLEAHAHATEGGRHDARAPFAGHAGGHDETAIHASCDVVVASPAVLRVERCSSIGQALSTTSDGSSAPFVPEPPSPSASPPRYLTHRVLLI